MWEHNHTTNLLARIILNLFLVGLLLNLTLALSDKRLCADENCKEIISVGTGLITYPSGEEGTVSFKINSNIRIISKSAGKDPSLWGIEVNGRKGYAPKKFIRETKVFIKDDKLKHIVDVKPINPVPILTTSEKMVEQENIIEKTTTKPLNLTPVESTENPLKVSSSEKLTAENSPSATPVMSDILDGTKIPNFSNSDENNKNLSDKKEIFKNLEANTEGQFQLKENSKEQNADANNDAILHSTEVDDKNLNKKTEQVQKHGVEKDINIVSSNITKETNSNIVREAETKIVESVHDVGKEHESDAEKEKENINAEFLQQNESIKISINSQNSSDTQHMTQTEDQLNANVTENFKEPKGTDSNNDVLKMNVTIVEEKDVNDKIEQAKKDNGKNEINVVSGENGFDDVGKHDVLQNSVNLNEISQHSESYNISNNSQTTLGEKNTTQIENQVNNAEHVAKEKYSEDLSSQNTQQISKNIKENNNNYLQDDSNDESGKSLNITRNIKENINNYLKGDSNDETGKSGNVNNSSKGDELSTNNGTLDINTNENNETISANKSIDNMSNLPRETENLQFHKENLLSDSVKSEYNTNSNPHKQIKTLSENVLQGNESILNEASKVSEVVISEQKIANMEENIYQTPNVQKHDAFTGTEVNSEEISSESRQQVPNVNEDIKAITYDTDTDVKNQVVEQITTQSSEYYSNTDNSKNQQRPPVEQDSQNLSYQRYKTDQQIVIDNTNTLPAEKVHLEPIPSEFGTSTKSDEKLAETPNNLPLKIQEEIVNAAPKIFVEILTQEETLTENINPIKYSTNNEAVLNTPPSTHYDYTYQELPTTNIPPKDKYYQQYKVLEDNLHSPDSQSIESYQDVPTISQPLQEKYEQAKSMQYPTPSFDNFEAKETEGLFAKIMGTVNNMLSISKKNKQNGDLEFDKTLSSENANEYKDEKINKDIVLEDGILYCKNIGPNGDCPETAGTDESSTVHFHRESAESVLSTDFSLEAFLQILASKILEISELLAFLFIVAAACLFFIFGYYCFCNSSREGALLSKLNQLESSLLATHKENAILKYNLMSTRQKLVSIEDNSFGSNDMVVSLRKELEEELMEKARLQEQITVLQKELENAADAGIELNKIVSELLSNQTGDESIISSVEELQKQLNEQQNTILDINASLAEKSRENSELQLLIAEQNARYETELANVQRDNDELEQDKGNLLTRLDEMKNDFDKDLTSALEGKNLEIKRLQNEVVDLANKLENEHIKWQTSVAKVEALEECLKNVRRDPHVNIAEVIDVAYVKAQLIETQRKYKSLKDRLETELDSRKLVENQLEVVSAEVEKLKYDFNQSEKDKLEAQTRLEVLSNYFKDKENQLQKELSLKEAMWLKQQGETTTTVDRVTVMQEEMQSLKSQNDSLRAEIEAQIAAHKAQTGTLENRAHETWLAARQSDRRCEEARAEATALRRKLTALAGGNVNEANKSSAVPAGFVDELAQAPSPIHMESPGSPMLGRIPPPSFLPPPFMGPPPPFMGMPPPPPFVPSGEMRPAPLGRIMSPPPQRSGRFSPQHLDYDDYLDYEGNNAWHRHTYSPPPRTYRSLSPTDSRYNYGTERDLMSTYDTETDFSPPPSPRESRRRSDNSSERIDNNTKMSYGIANKFNNSIKGPLSSGSEKSFNTPSHNDSKAKKGNASLGGKALV